MCSVMRFTAHDIQPCDGRIAMNSTERHERRYQRRKAMREQRKQDRSRAVGGLGRVFSYHEMFRAGKKCCNGVRWKNSTQRFELHLFSQTAKTRKRLFLKTWKPDKYFCFIRRERGKERPISAPTIRDRQVHKVLTRRALLPLYAPDMIYNNGASIPGKGFQFSRNQLCKDLRQHFRIYGRDGFVLLLDFTKFFPSVPHSSVYARHLRILRHPNIRELADKIVASIPGGYGLPLGVEVSQMEMVSLPSPVDNFIKCQLSMKHAGHYMDDYYVIVPPDRDPFDILAKITEKARSIGLTVSQKKTQIRPLTKPFKYCKAKYTLTETGRVIVNGNRDSVKRARRKFKYFHGQVESGEMSLEDLRQAVQPTFAYFDKYNDHGRVLRLRRLFYALFGFSAEDKENFKEVA